MAPDNTHNYRLVALFFLGYILLNYPLIDLFNLPKIIWGVPLLYGYIFGAWILLILLANLIFKVPDTPS